MRQLALILIIAFSASLGACQSIAPQPQTAATPPPSPPPQSRPDANDEDATDSPFGDMTDEEIDALFGDETGDNGDSGLGVSGSGQGGGGTGTGTIGFGSIGSIGSGGGSASPHEQYLSDECYSRGEGDAASGSGYTCITLLYGTNREAQTDFGERLDDQEAFTVRPDPTCEPGRVAVGARYCHLGLLTVTVPDSRQRGDRINAVPRDAIRVTDRQRRRLFSVWNYEALDENDFSALASDMLADAVGQLDGEFDNQVIVFIHGFNVRFRDAAFRAAQIKYDLDFPGPVFFYSWPANGSVMHYLSDMDDADLSVDGLVDFLQLVRNSVPGADINVIAHSMGTRVFAQALNRLVLEDPDFALNHVFFASGDLDRNLFVEWVSPAADNMESVTLYTSGSDVAVASSQLLRNLFPSRDREDRDIKSRIGFFSRNTHPPVFGFAVGSSQTLPHTIDMTRERFSFFGFATRYLLRRARLGHSDYMERTPIIDDMSCILRRGISDPALRHSALSETSDEAGGIYWHFGADGDQTDRCLDAAEE